MRGQLLVTVAVICHLAFFCGVPVSGSQVSYSIWICMAEEGQVRLINSSDYDVSFALNITAGESPWAIDFSPDGERAYVACHDSGNVVVVDAETLEETTSVDVGFRPFDICVSPDGRFACISNMEDGTVSVVDLETVSVLATIEVGTKPLSIAIGPDGSRAYVCLREVDGLAVVDLKDLSVLSTIDVEGGPWGVGLHPDGVSAYVSCESADQVAVVDLEEGRVVKRIGVNQEPRGVVILPDGESVYVPAKEAVAIIDVSSNSKIDASGIHGWGWGAVIVPDGSHAFVSTVGEAEGVEVIDTSRMEKIESIYLGEGTSGARGIAIHPVSSSGIVTTTISCLAEARVREGGLLNISGAISPPLGDRPVTLIFVMPNGTSINRDVTTGSDGRFSHTFSPETGGEWELKSVWEGDDRYSSASSVGRSFTVGRGDEGPPPFIVIGAIAVLVILALVLLRRRRGPSGEPVQQSRSTQASRIIQIARDIMILPVSVILLVSSYGKWVEEPVHYILFGSAAVLLCLTIVNLILLALNVRRKGYFYFNATVQVLLGFPLIVAIFGIALIIVNVIIIVALKKSKVMEVPAES